jgi:integrase
MARPRTLPPGLSRRGKTLIYSWRDASGRTYCRKAGDTTEEALAFKATVDVQLADHSFSAGTRTTFADYAAHWVETHPLKSQTRRGYRSTLTAHLVPFFGPYQLAKITPALVRLWYRQQQTLGLANNTVREHVAILKSVLKTAQTDGHISYLPTGAVRVPRQERRRPTVLPLAEAWQVVSAAPEPWRALFATAVFTGLRLGEILALRRDDIDLDRRVLRVTGTMSEVAGRVPRLVREQPKSAAGIRDVPLIEPLAELMSDHVVGLPPAQQLLFATPAGRPLDRSAVYRVWHPLRAAVGRPELRFHDLRHTAASLLLTFSGAQLLELKEIMGHSQIAHTVDLYGHLVPGRLDAIRESFGAALREAIIGSG